MRFSPDSLMSPKFDNWLFCLLSVCFLSGALPGCNGSSSPGRAVNPSGEVKNNVADECGRKLKSVIARMQPEAMATQTRKGSIASSLNSWMSSCVSKDDAKLALSEANNAMLSSSVQRAVGQNRFTEGDVNYIRDCLLLNQLTESLWNQTDSTNGGQISSDLQRVQRLFRHILGNVSPLKADEARIPLGMYEVMLTGRGSVEDRIWILAEALRQRQIDSVLFTASSPGDPKASSLVDAADQLLVVIVEERALLFDPLRGTAVPKIDDPSIIVTDPADVSLIVESERWKAATPLIVSNPAAFAPRMFLLQQRMEADDAATMYEELAGGTSEIRPLVQRLSAALGATWPIESFRVWDFPELRTAAAAALSELEKEEYMLLMRPLDSPFERDSTDVSDPLDDPSINQDALKDEERLALQLRALEERFLRESASSDALFGKPSKALLFTRIRQISGDVAVDLIADFQQIRHANMKTTIDRVELLDGKYLNIKPEELPQSIRNVQQSALGDTLYWTSMLQLTRNDSGAAISTLRNYRIQYPTGAAAFPSMMNEADALIAHGNTADAIAVLKQADVEQNPEQIRAQWWLSRLESAE